MNLAAVKKICTENKVIHILNNRTTGEQWIGNGLAMYLVDSEIDINDSNVLQLFDIEPDDKKAPCVCVDHVRVPQMFATAGAHDIEEALEDVGCVWYGGELWRALLSEAGLLFVPIRYLKPIKAKDYCEFYLRRIGKNICVAVYGDMFASAILSPVIGKAADKMRLTALTIGEKGVYPKDEDEEEEFDQMTIFEGAEAEK